MKKRLIIDSQLVAQDPSGVFDTAWGWPITQRRYDDLITEFIEWSDELHHELNDSARLQNAFLLIKADLLKDLSYYSTAWIDIATAHGNGNEVVFNPNQYIYSALISNQFGERLPTENNRTQIAVGLQAKIRSRLSRFKRDRINNHASKSGGKFYLIGPNHLGLQIAPGGTRLLRINMGDIARHRPTSADIPSRLHETARHISEALCAVISKHTNPPTAAFESHINFIASQYLQKGWIDAALPPMFAPPQPGSTLITGTGSSYAKRLTSYQFRSEGHTVLRTSHGGDSPLFDDLLESSIELPFASKYIVHGDAAAIAVNRGLALRSESHVAHYTDSAIAVGSDFHAQILSAAAKPTNQKVKTVSVIAASFTGQQRVTPHMKLHDVVYIEWHRRLLKGIRELGYSAISKRHPKGMMSGQAIFGDIADEELLKTPMNEIEQRTDAYVIDFLASAFMESICTLKPVVLIDLPIRRMRPEARALLSKSVAIVSASFDEKNRVVINTDELRNALEQPVQIYAREQLIQDYLLRPSPNIDSLFE